jgi:hypothetical protein
VEPKGPRGRLITRKIVVGVLAILILIATGAFYYFASSSSTVDYAPYVYGITVIVILFVIAASLAKNDRAVEPARAAKFKILPPMD